MSRKNIPVAERSSSVDQAYVLRPKTLFAFATVKRERLALSQLLKDRPVLHGAPMHEIFLAVLARNKAEPFL